MAFALCILGGFRKIHSTMYYVYECMYGSKGLHVEHDKYRITVTCPIFMACIRNCKPSIDSESTIISSR